jgi:hypothetical protein
MKKVKFLNHEGTRTQRVVQGEAGAIVLRSPPYRLKGGGSIRNLVV